MSESTYDLARYAADLRRITSEETDDRRILQRIRPLALKLAATPGWVKDAYYDCDAAQGFGTHLLHEDADHGTAVFAIAWLPPRGSQAISTVNTSTCRRRAPSSPASVSLMAPASFAEFASRGRQGP